MHKERWLIYWILSNRNQHIKCKKLGNLQGLNWKVSYFNSLEIELDWGLGRHTHVFTCIETLRKEDGRSLVRPVPSEDIGDDLMSIFWCKRIATSIQLQVDFGKEIPSHATSILIYISEPPNDCHDIDRIFSQCSWWGWVVLLRFML